jgi:hypothetical protein
VMRHKLTLYVLPILLVSVAVGGLLVEQALNRPVHGQEGAFTLKVLLERLKAQMEDESGFLITLQFAVPLVEGENSWTIGSPTDENRTYISEVGNDYLCLTETSGAAVLTRCIPFSNIASISYLEN